MTVKQVLFICICTLIVFITGSSVSAHHLWVEKSNDTYIVARGVLGERHDIYNPDRVMAFAAIGADGKRVSEEMIRRSDEPDRARFEISEQVSMTTVSCDWGYRVNTTKGKKLMSKPEAEKENLRIISAFFSTQYSKVFFEKGIGNTIAAGLKFEMIPLNDPVGLHEGDVLPVQVLFDGRPLANVVITSAAREEIPTDSNGVGHFKLTKKGKTLLMLGQKVPVKDDPEKDYHLYTTFMVFEVK